MPGLTTAFAQGVAASRPAAASSNAGYCYFATDTGILSQSTGSSWTTIGPAVALDALTTKGDVLTRSSSAYSRLGVGSNDQVLTADSTASTGLKWATPSSGFSDPTTTRGDLIVRGGSGTTRLALGSSGQVPRSDGTDVAWATPALTQIASSVLGSSAASITFSSISGSYNALQIVLQGRSDASATAVSLLLQCNGDTAANYDDEMIRYYATNTASSEDIAATSAIVGGLSAATAPAGDAGVSTIIVPNYAGTTFRKQFTSHSVFCEANATTGMTVRVLGGQWRSTSAITSILLKLSSGSFIAGTSCWLYGWL